MLLARPPGGITALDAACALNDTDNPRPADKEKARRRLDKLERAGLLILLDPSDQATNRPARMGCHMTYPMTCTTVWGPNQHAPCMAYTLQAQQTYMSYTLPDLHVPGVT